MALLFEQGVEIEVIFTPRESYNGRVLREELRPYIGQRIKVVPSFFMGDPSDKYPGEWALEKKDEPYIFKGMRWVASGDVSEVAAQLVLTGFKSEEEIDVFLTWLSNSGRQDLGDDLECRRREGKVHLPTFISVDLGSKQGHETFRDKLSITQKLQFYYSEDSDYYETKPSPEHTDRV